MGRGNDQGSIDRQYLHVDKSRQFRTIVEGIEGSIRPVPLLKIDFLIKRLVRLCRPQLRDESGYKGLSYPLSPSQ